MCEIGHCVPILRFNQQTFAGGIQYEILFFNTIVASNDTASLNTNCCLNSFMVSMSSPNRVINPINVKYSLYIKWDGFFDASQIPSLVCVCCQVNYISHIINICIYFYLRKPEKLIVLFKKELIYRKKLRLNI